MKKMNFAILGTGNIAAQMADTVSRTVSYTHLDVYKRQAYFCYAESELRRNFRTPETYNILLYGMATGYNRISQLSEFSGFPQNKCEMCIRDSFYFFPGSCSFRRISLDQIGQ